MKSRSYFLLVLIFVSFSTSKPSGKNIEVGVDEQLGKYVPSDAQFIDEAGDTVLLGDLIKRPTVLAFVYYQCP